MCLNIKLDFTAGWQSEPKESSLLRDRPGQADVPGDLPSQANPMQMKSRLQDSIASMLSSETGSEAGPGLVTNSVPAALVQPTYLLASPGVARVSSLMADRQEELTRALQD